MTSLPPRAHLHELICIRDIYVDLMGHSVEQMHDMIRAQAQGVHTQDSQSQLANTPRANCTGVHNK